MSAQFLFVGCSDERILRLELETGEERYSNVLGGGGVQEIVISRSGETFAAVCDDCKVRCRGRLRHATWQDLPAGGRQRQESRSSSESMNFSNSEDEAPQKCQQEEMRLGMSQQTLQEMTKLAPRRVYYPRGMTAMEQVNFHSLPGLCAHEGLAFLAHNAHMASGANGCTRLGAGPIGAEPALQAIPSCFECPITQEVTRDLVLDIHSASVDTRASTKHWRGRIKLLATNKLLCNKSNCLQRNQHWRPIKSPC